MSVLKIPLIQELKMKSLLKLLASTLLIAQVLTACGNNPGSPTAAAENGARVEYELTTAFKDGRMLYVGVGGAIAGVENPTLKANVGDTVVITLSSGEALNTTRLPDFNAA
jgi:nitrite reductase (NO-forming)